MTFTIFSLLAFPPKNNFCVDLSEVTNGFFFLIGITVLFLSSLIFPLSDYGLANIQDVQEEEKIVIFSK